MFSLQDADDYKENVTSSIPGVATLTTGPHSTESGTSTSNRAATAGGESGARKKKDSVEHKETLGKLLGSRNKAV
jgi:hypothetical protein